MTNWARVVTTRPVPAIFIAPLNNLQIHFFERLTNSHPFHAKQYTKDVSRDWETRNAPFHCNYCYQYAVADECEDCERELKRRSQEIGGLEKKSVNLEEIGKSRRRTQWLIWKSQWASLAPFSFPARTSSMRNRRWLFRGRRTVRQSRICHRFVFPFDLISYINIYQRPNQRIIAKMSNAHFGSSNPLSASGIATAMGTMRRSRKLTRLNADWNWNFFCKKNKRKTKPNRSRRVSILPVVDSPKAGTGRPVARESSTWLARRAVER